MSIAISDQLELLRHLECETTNHQDEHHTNHQNAKPLNQEEVLIVANNLVARNHLDAESPSDQSQNRGTHNDDIPTIAHLKNNYDERTNQPDGESLGPTCRICHMTSSCGVSADLISPCRCKGSLKFVHNECLDMWFRASGKHTCEVCRFQYSYHKKFRNWKDAILAILLLLLIFVFLFGFCVFVFLFGFCWSIAELAAHGVCDLTFKEHTMQSSR